MSRFCDSCQQTVDTFDHFCATSGTHKDPLEETKPQDPLIGTVLENKYQIEQSIGQGGMATVYKANHLALHRNVAIKFLAFNRSNDPASMRRFQQEGKAVSNLSHPNIVGMHDIGVTAAGQPYLVMDYLKGTNLAQLIYQRGCIDLSEAITMFSQVCDGLAHAHERSIVHRDLKPSNIMICEGTAGDAAQVKIFDFGIAKLLIDSEGGNKLTQTGEIFGSPLYMSPEQCQGLEADHRSDVYSFGCMLYEALAGEPPLHGTNPLQTLSMHIMQPPESIRTIRADLNLPEELDSLLTKALAKNPRDRYQSIRDLKFDLELLRSAKPTLSLPVQVAAETKKDPTSKYMVRVPLRENDAAIGLFVSGLATSLAAGGLCFFPQMHIVSFLLFELAALMFIVGIVSWQVGLILTGSRTKRTGDERFALGLIPDHLRRVNRLLAYNLASSNKGDPESTQLRPLRLGTEKETYSEFMLTGAVREHNPHMLIVGAAGSGKTYMMAQAIQLDCVERKHSAIVIDQSGDLTSLFNPNRDNLIKVIDPLDDNCKFSFSLLSLPELDLVARADLGATAFSIVHQNLSAKAKSWSSQTSELLRFALIVLALNKLDLGDLMPLLTDEKLRDELVKVAAENADELPTNYFSDLRKAIESLSDKQWDRHLCCITEVWLPAMSQRTVQSFLLSNKENIDLGELIRKRKSIIIRIGTKDSGSDDLVGSLIVAAVLTYAQLNYANANKHTPCMIYLDGCDGIVDSALLSQIMSDQNQHLKLGLIASTRSIERLPANCRDVFLNRIGMLCAFKLMRADAGLVARYLMPAENIYSGSADENSRTMRETMDSLMDQSTREYFCRIREATAGVFQLEAPEFQGVPKADY